MSTTFNFENLKWLLGTLAIPATLGYVSYVYQQSQAERQLDDARLRLYTELLSKREDADTSVRRGIFDKVLETYLKPGQQDLQVKIVALELLAANFHDALDLGPLFWQLDREVEGTPGSRKTSLARQLARVANDVKDRQVGNLEAVGKLEERQVQLEDTKNPVIDADFSFANPDALNGTLKSLKRHFTVSVAEHDPERKRVYVHVRASPATDERQWGFWLDVFDFPMANFTRLSKEERFTVVLKRYEPPSAHIALIYFPGARSGVRDKPFLDEVISDLVHNKRPGS